MAANIVESLFTEFLSDNTVGNLASASGVSKDNVSEVIATAIPALLGAMAGNVSTEDGAKSLSKALVQHASKTKLNVAEEVKNADQEDGQKIIKNILGSDLSDTVTALAKNVNIDKKDVSKILSMIAPMLLTFIASSKKSSKKTDSATDMSSLLGSLVTTALTGGKSKSASSASVVTSLVSSLLTSKTSSGNKDAADLVGALLKSVL